MARLDPALSFLNDCLMGNKPTAADLDRFIADAPKEGTWHDFKSGLILSNSKKAAATVREYVSAFANSDGGVLLIGSNNSRVVDGASAPGGGTLDEWAARSLDGLRSYLTPPPRIFSVVHPSGEVLVIATGRASVLVPVVESGRLQYYVRLGDTTAQLPEYLLGDLLLGRRARPRLEVVEFTAKCIERRHGTQAAVVELTLWVEAGGATS